MSKKLDKDTRNSLEEAVNMHDNVFDTISNAIDWYFENNPKDDPRTGDEFIEWKIVIGEVLANDD